MELQPIVFKSGQDPTPPLTQLKQALLKQAEDHFELGFRPHPEKREEILWAIQRLMSLENMKAALFPQRPLRKEDVVPLTPQIKEAEMAREQLEDFGVIPSYAEDIHLYASLYVLPAPPPFAQQASSHPEEYAQTRPYIQKSQLCKFPNQEPAYYIEMGAYGFTGTSVVFVRQEGPIGYYHLAPACWNGSQKPLRTESVRFLDGMKIYFPIQIQDGDQVYDRTFVLSTTLSIWEGFKGWVKDQRGPEYHATVYGLGGASEILAVLKRLPAPTGSSRTQYPTAAK